MTGKVLSFPEEAVRAVAAAWVDEGLKPEFHRKSQRRLRREWPTLANAVEALVKGATLINETIGESND